MEGHLFIYVAYYCDIELSREYRGTCTSMEINIFTRLAESA